MINATFQRGLYLPSIDLWLDPWEAKRIAFVSHAHSDHIAPHAEVIASHGTARLMIARLAGTRVAHSYPFHEPFVIPGAQLTMVPAGHIFGSAQLHVQTDEGSLLYTGDFKLRKGKSAEPAEALPADVLVMETTYGLPKFAFPPAEEVVADIVKFCREAMEEHCVPILLGYSLGKAQEILCTIAEAGMRPMLHASVYRMTRIYEELGFPLPEYDLLDTANTEGRVLICPPGVGRSAQIQKIKKKQMAVLTGWALIPGASYRYQCDAAFPLSDHADYPDLIRYVEMVRPKRVLTLHGYASEFAATLRARGIEAWSLTSNDQLELTLNLPFDTKTGAASPEIESTGSEFHRFAKVGTAISGTTGKLKKIEILGEYFRSLDDERLPLAAVYLTGRPFPQTDARVLNLGWAVTRRALLAVSRMPEAELRAISRQHADAGKTVLEALAGKTAPEPFTLPEADTFFNQLHGARGPIAKSKLLAQRLARLTPLEAAFIVRVMSGDLRIGLKEGLVEEALAACFSVEIDELKEANMLSGDIGKTALLARHRCLDQAELQVFQPIKCMLASPEPTAEAVYRRIIEEGGAERIWIEDKFDGIRMQMHIDDGKCELFTRDLKRVTSTFDEIATAGRASGLRAILDGEIIAREEGRTLGFADLQKRLGRKTGDLFLSSEIPVLYQIFDLLWLDGQSWLRRPLSARREALDRLVLPRNLERIPVTQAATPEEIDSAFNEARVRGNEGLIVKDPGSLYSPGRRGLAWLKLKKELTTLDVVVVGAEWGHGKRSNMLSDCTFAIREDKTGNLLTIGKAYSGLTDLEIHELTKFFLKTTIDVRGRFHQVEPKIVLEVAFDSIQPSDRHQSGLAMRFPRIKAIRRDKTPDQIDTLAFARSLVGAVHPKTR